MKRHILIYRNILIRKAKMKMRKHKKETNENMKWHNLAKRSYVKEKNYNMKRRKLSEYVETWRQNKIKEMAESENTILHKSKVGNMKMRNMEMRELQM